MGDGEEGISIDASFRALREESLLHFKAMSTYQLAAVTATFVIMGMFFTNQVTDPFAFMAPLMIIIPFAFDYATRCEDICRIGAYIQVFLEQDHPGWESRMHRVMEVKGDAVLPHSINRFLYSLTFPLLSASSILMTVYRLDHAAPAQITWIVVLLVIAIALQAYATYRITVAFRLKKRHWHLQQWQSIRKQELFPDKSSTAATAETEPSAG